MDIYTCPTDSNQGCGKPYHGSFRDFLGNLKIRWSNWKVRGAGKAYRALTKAMHDDLDYAHSWQCNIAMPIFDGAKGKLTAKEANVIADDLMRHLFEVKNCSERFAKLMDSPVDSEHF